jgi:hypothetical protein
MIFYLFQILIISFSFAQEVSFIDKKPKYFLEAKTCMELNNQIDQFNLLKLKQPSLKSKCLCQNKCRIEISSLLPEKLIKLLSMSREEGPNCFNSVLFLKGIASSPSYSEAELEYWLDSPLCTQVSPGQPKPGDIINFTYISDITKKYAQMHSFLHLSNEMVFTKDGPEKKESYRITNYKDVIEKFGGLEPDCKNITKFQGSKIGCEKISTYYRCEKFEDFISKEVDIDLNVLNSYKKLKSESQCITGDLSNSNKKMNELAAQNLKILNALASDNLKIPNFESLPTSIQAKINNLAQMSLNAHVENSNKVLSKDEREETFDYFKEIYRTNSFLLTEPKFEAAVENEFAEISALMKENKIIINQEINLSESLIWSNIYLNTRSLLWQEQLFK